MLDGRGRFRVIPEHDMSLDPDAKVLIPFDEAEKRLPDGPEIHTFRQAGPMLLGADYERGELLKAMREAEAIELTGPAATAMHHGLAIQDKHGLLFIATRRT